MSDTVTRAFELPLHSLDDDLRDLLRACWRQSADLANWCVRALVRHDVNPTPAQRAPGCKLPPMPTWPKGGLYRLASREFGLMSPGSFWAGAAGSFSSVTKTVEDYWRQHRWEILWRGTEQPPCWESYPFPVRGQEWTGTGYDDDGKPWVEVNLPSGTPRKPIRARLRLRSGPEFGRQLALFRQVVEGSLPRKQLIIRAQRCSESCHRPLLRIGGEPHRVLVKMVADLPRREKPGGRTLTLITDPGAFWVAELDGRPAWVLNADHVRRGLARHAEHLRVLQRMGQDAKAERRLGSNRAAHQQARLKALCHKDRNRLASWTHETAAHLVGFAVRQGVGEVLYLDRDRGFCPRFPWFELHTKLSAKLDAAGIDFYSESSLVRQSNDALNPTDAVEVADIQPTTEDEKWARIARLREMATGRLVRARKRPGSHPAVSAP